MKFVFDTLRQIRANTWKALEGYSEEQLGIIPDGYGNNIAWNLGHMVATQQILCYRLAGAPEILPDSFISMYKKDTSPKDWTKPADIKEIKQFSEITLEAFPKDYEKKIFNNYKTYTTSAGVTLTCIDDALVYNYGHENLHYGVILAMRKLIGTR
jgi:hypothetical protein